MMVILHFHMFATLIQKKKKKITLWLFHWKAAAIKLLNVSECQKNNEFKDFGFRLKIFTTYHWCENCLYGFLY